jgi:hypothetical protein
MTAYKTKAMKSEAAINDVMQKVNERPPATSCSLCVHITSNGEEKEASRFLQPVMISHLEHNNQPQMKKKAVLDWH